MNPNNPTIRAALRRKARKVCEVVAEYYNLPIDAVHIEMLDFFQIVAMGAKKYAMNNWLEPDGKNISEKHRHGSLFRHVSESYVTGSNILENIKHGIGEKVTPKDKESGLDPLLHVQCNAAMLYTRRQKGIIHPEDTK